MPAARHRGVRRRAHENNRVLAFGPAERQNLSFGDTLGQVANVSGYYIDSVGNAGTTPVYRPTTGQQSAESELVGRAIDGDEVAFTGLYDQHYDRVYRYAYFRTRSVQDAEDITQRVFLKAWKAIDGYRPTTTPFVAWLVSIAHNEVVTHYRSRRPQEPLSSELTDALHRDDIAEDVIRADESESLVSAILTLNADQQQVIYMRFIDGFDCSEIAASIGKTEGNVRVIQHRGLCALRRLLGRDTKR